MSRLKSCSGLARAFFLLSTLTLAQAIPSVEVVLSHYDEDTAWISQFPHVNFTIYSKSPKPFSLAKEQLPNLGRESDTYLHHIIKHYNDSLADWTVFSQATAPALGHTFGRTSGHLVEGVTFQDYLQPRDDSYFIFSGASSFPQEYHTERLTLKTRRTQKKKKSLRRQNKQTNEDATPPVPPCPLSSTGWDDWWWLPPRVHFEKRPQPNDPSSLEFYEQYVAEKPIPNRKQGHIFVFTAGARFAVSRKAIHRRPLEYYKRLKDQLQTLNPIQGFYMETFWYDVFHPQGLQVDVPPCTSFPEIDADVIMKNYYATKTYWDLLKDSGGHWVVAISLALAILVWKKNYVKVYLRRSISYIGAINELKQSKS